MPATETFRPWPADPRFMVGDGGTVLGVQGQPIGSQMAQGYTVVAYRDASGRRRSTVTSSMVCETFHGERPAGHQAAHNNGDPSDNRVGNLRWATRADNMGDRLRHGTNGIRLTAEQVTEIRASTDSRNDLAMRYDVTPGTISHVRTGRTWRTPLAS